METFLVSVLDGAVGVGDLQSDGLDPGFRETRPSPFSPTASLNTPSPSKSHWYPEQGHNPAVGDLVDVEEKVTVLVAPSGWKALGRIQRWAPR